MQQEIDLEDLLFKERKRVRLLGIDAFCWKGPKTIALHVTLGQFPSGEWSGEMFIYCEGTYDFAIRPADPNCLEGGPYVELRDDDVRLWHLLKPVCELTLPAAQAKARWTPSVRAVVLADLRQEHEGITGGRIPFELPSGFTAVEAMSGHDLKTRGPGTLLSAYERVLRKHGFEPILVEKGPPVQLVPGSDGEAYDPPKAFRLLVLDQSYVIAERFRLVRPLTVRSSVGAQASK